MTPFTFFSFSFYNPTNTLVDKEDEIPNESKGLDATLDFRRSLVDDAHQTMYGRKVFLANCCNLSSSQLVSDYVGQEGDTLSVSPQA